MTQTATEMQQTQTRVDARLAERILLPLAKPTCSPMTDKSLDTGRVLQVAVSPAEVLRSAECSHAASSCSLAMPCNSARDRPQRPRLEWTPARARASRVFPLTRQRDELTRPVLRPCLSVAKRRELSSWRVFPPEVVWPCDTHGTELAGAA